MIAVTETHVLQQKLDIEKGKICTYASRSQYSYNYYTYISLIFKLSYIQMLLDVNSYSDIVFPFHSKLVLATFSIALFYV